MKRNRLLLLAALFCSSTTLLNAQSSLDQQSGGSKQQPSEALKQKAEIKKNIVKINLMALGLKNYSFQYERVLSKRVSVALGVRTMPTGGLPFKNNIIETVGSGDPQVTQAINDFKAGNFAVTPELRFYLSKKGYGRGFYIAPYYRFARFNSEELPIEFDADAGGTKTIRLKGDVTTHSGGLMFGAQWQLGKVVTLDWWILGGHYGTSSGTLSGTPSPALTANEQNEIRNIINDFELPLTNITAEVSANNVRAIVDGPWAGVRAGLTIGIRF
jgi:hypothetical protein